MSMTLENFTIKCRKFIRFPTFYLSINTNKVSQLFGKNSPSETRNKQVKIPLLNSSHDHLCLLTYLHCELTSWILNITFTKFMFDC